VNRRVLLIALLILAVLGVGTYVLTGPSSRPAPSTTTAATPSPAPTPAPAPPPAAPPRAAAPPVEAPRSTEPRRRPGTPAPAASATPAPAAASVGTAAMLTVEADVPDAQVFVDRVFIGKAPVTTSDVTPGSHRLNVSATGYEGVAQTIDVKVGQQQVTVKLRDVRLDAAIDVVHKHRLGSCSGRLSATPHEMRYATSDSGDAFRTPLLNIETLEVDYLKKNLHIKVKQGKSYDFTDPEGNADRLFVFHRDVTKAIERLKKGDTPAEP
jgi:hypothetical protein